MKRKWVDDKGYKNVSYSKAVIPVGPPLKRKKLSIPKNIVYGKYANYGYRKSSEIKTLDSTFSGNYTAGTYTPDTIQTSPYQMLPLNNGTATIQAVNLCQQGAGISQRVGNKISLKSLRLRFSLVPTGEPQTVSTAQRILVIYDRQPSSTYPAVNTILSSINGGNVIVNGTWDDGINPNFMDRLVVLMDEKIQLPVYNNPITNVISGYSSELCNFSIDRFVKLRDLDTTFSGSNATMTVSLISTGALYLICYGQAGLDTADGWQLHGTARLRYRDN